MLRIATQGKIFCIINCENYLYFLVFFLCGIARQNERFYLRMICSSCSITVFVKIIVNPSDRPSSHVFGSEFLKLSLFFRGATVTKKKYDDMYHDVNINCVLKLKDYIQICSYWH